EVRVDADRMAAVEIQAARGARRQQQVQPERRGARAVRGEQCFDAVEDAGPGQVQAQRETLRRLAAHLVEVPGASRAQGETTAELVLAQTALDDHDAVSGK